ncbi:MAG: glycosyltransferase [Clostridia bacterium]|nr:glycosyltransferase [Clostridia bacterium]
MKALILSVKAGYGHHSTGLAMKDCLNAHGIDCEMLDTLEYISRFLGEGVQDGYLIATKYLREAYGKVYDTLDKKDEPSKSYSPEAIITKFLSKKLERYMMEYNPDFVIGTHSYAAVLMTVLQKHGVLNCPTFGIVTDFTIHPFWESSRLDYYVLPDGLLSSAAGKKGINPSRVLPFGIPVREQFTVKNDKEEMKRKLGLPKKPMVLIMMGSMGFGDMTGVIEACDRYDYDYQLVVICGNNDKAKSAIDSRQWSKPVRCLGFTVNVDEYMDAAEIIITKPGGLTTSEAMAKGLPLILMNPIPGQEERNMEFLVNSGVAMMISKTFPLESALYQFFEYSWRREIMERAVSEIGKPDSTHRLYDFICEKVYRLNKGVLQENMK